MVNGGVGGRNEGKKQENTDKIMTKRKKCGKAGGGVSASESVTNCTGLHTRRTYYVGIM
jgi:hypothetical protein